MQLFQVSVPKLILISNQGRVAFVVLSLVLSPCALVGLHAQELEAQGKQGEKEPSQWVEPRVTVQGTYTTNSRLTGFNPESDLIASISPGLRAVLNTARVTGVVDYALNGYYFAQGTFGNGLRHTLNAQSMVSLWDNHLFVDLLGVADRVAISAFGPQVPGVPKNDNLSQSANFQVSPYFKGTLSGSTDYEVRYFWRTFNTNTSERSDFDKRSFSARLESQKGSRKLGWSLDALHETYDYTLGRKTQRRTILGKLLYTPANDLDLSFSLGKDVNDQLTRDSQTYSTSGASVDWRMSDRSRLTAGVDRSFFGNGYSLVAEHKTARTIWRYSARRAIASTSLEDAVPFGYSYELYDLLFETLESDPVKRAQLVAAELAKRGLESPADLYRNFLASSATLEQLQEASLLLLGIRTVTTFTVARGSSRRLDSLVGAIGDDFDLSSNIKRQVWRLDVSYRMNPLTAVNGSLSNRKLQSASGNLRTSVDSATVGMSTRLGLRTSGSVQISHSRSQDSVDPYSVTSVFGAINHRF